MLVPLLLDINSEIQWSLNMQNTTLKQSINHSFLKHRNITPWSKQLPKTKVCSSDWMKITNIDLTILSKEIKYNQTKRYPTILPLNWKLSSFSLIIRFFFKLDCLKCKFSTMKWTKFEWFCKLSASWSSLLQYSKSITHSLLRSIKK